MEQSLRPLGTVMQLLEELGHEVTYAYEDLVFVNHSDFLLQFGETGSVMHLFFNSDCPKKNADSIEESLIPAADKKGLSISKKGRYSLSEQPDENLQIRFFDM
ncbi:MAG: hypothetical protein K9G39_03780 [Chlorobium sp.]|uniref:hypothetical protein n=1 Tax=Chlorobium sp. TaxID=1095 RepID=UPI0025BA42DE|nr:hypothetical protein [Chlorobium sp.]MCF8382706.1 hypothetical protein [Chlorobium sp.]